MDYHPGRAITALALAGALSLSAIHAGERRSSGRGAGDLEQSGHLVRQGGDSWTTRGGLVIRGRDPRGMSRLDHIMRHTADDPRRPRHGVFTVSRKEVIELMDAVWRKAGSGRLHPRVRGRNAAYTDNTGRDIGYLGGREGTRKGQPRLRSVRLVVRRDTAEVITFFPTR